MSTVLILSGGLDSTVLLHDLVRKGKSVAALTVDYGQRHSKEIEFARLNCEILGVEHKTADLTALRSLLSGSSLAQAFLSR